MIDVSTITCWNWSVTLAPSCVVYWFRPNENKISHRLQARAWRRELMVEPWKPWSYAG
jgi:hypothetical protein